MNKILDFLKMEFMRLAFLFSKTYIVVFYVIICGVLALGLNRDDIGDLILYNEIWLWLILMIVPPLIFKLVRGTRSDFREYYKEVIARPVFSEMLENVEFLWNGGISEWDMEDLRLVFMGNEFESEDHFCAEYKGIKIESADVKIQNYETMDNLSHTEDIFEGRIVILGGLCKNVKAVQIFSTDFMKRRSAAIPVTTYTTGDKIFDYQFAVAAAEHSEARELLTTQAMELFRTLYKKYDAVGAQFYDNNLALALGRKGGAMEPEPYRITNFERERLRMREEIQDILDIATTFGATNK